MVCLALLQLCKHNYLKHIIDKKRISSKIYLYLLQHLLYIKEIQKNKEKYPSLDIHQLIDLNKESIIQKKVGIEINKVLESKRKDEMDMERYVFYLIKIGHFGNIFVCFV
jgi:predicted nucleotidyltransferase